MLDRSRRPLLLWSGLCLAIFAVIAFLVTRDRSPLDTFDLLGRRAEDWADDYDPLRTVLVWVEWAFSNWAMTAYNVLLAVFLVWRRLQRAAIYLIGVTATTAVLTSVFKAFLGRARPDWQEGLHVLSSKSFPSGHASSVAALAAVGVVLAVMLIRRSLLRRTTQVALVAITVVVGLDRVLLGRHYPTDVLGGWLLGVGIALLWLAFLDPQPRSHAEKAEPLVESMPTAKRLSVVLNPIKVEDVGQFRSLVAAMAAETGWGEPTWYYTTIEDPGTGMAHDAAVAGQDPGSQAATAPCARCAPSSRAPASRSGSCPPARATCSRATSTSRCTCGGRSTWRSPGRTAPSTWSRSAATASTTPTSW